jgi:hypothetical protein
MLEGLAPAGLDSKATRGVVEHGTRLADGRQGRSELMFESLRAIGQPFEVRWRWSMLVMRLQPRCHSRLEMPATVIQRQRKRRWARGFAQAQPEAQTGCGGRKGESPELGNGAIQRVLVTTSRLQKLARGIFSRRERGAQASPEGRE